MGYVLDEGRHGAGRAPIMSRCYLIGWINMASHQLVRVSIASAYPVSQVFGAEHQAMLAVKTAGSYQEAHDAMMEALRGPALAWAAGLLR